MAAPSTRAVAASPVVCRRLERAVLSVVLIGTFPPAAAAARALTRGASPWLAVGVGLWMAALGRLLWTAARPRAERGGERSG